MAALTRMTIDVILRSEMDGVDHLDFLARVAEGSSRPHHSLVQLKKWTGTLPWNHLSQPDKHRGIRDMFSSLGQSISLMPDPFALEAMPNDVLEKFLGGIDAHGARPELNIADGFRVFHFPFIEIDKRSGSHEY